MAISQQLRIQYSEDIIIESIVASKPVIEYCRGIKFSSLTCELYDGVLWQIDQANINLFDNRIYETHDFTPKKNNYKNLKGRAEEMKQFHLLWEKTLEKERLSFQPHQFYFPAWKVRKLKGKVLLETHIDESIFLLCLKLPLKILMEILSIKGIRGNF